MNIEILQYCNLEMMDINKTIKNCNELILDLFSKNPHKVYSPKIIAEDLNLNYDTVESTLWRFVLLGKIQKLARGKYVLEPLPDGQSTLDKITMEVNQ